MANISSCDYCGERDMFFYLKVKDEYGTNSQNTSVTSAQMERPCIVPICSIGTGSPKTVEFDFTNSHFKDPDIIYQHLFYIKSDGSDIEEFFALPPGFGLDPISSGNTFLLRNGVTATLTGNYNDFNMTFDAQGVHQVHILSSGTNADGYSTNYKSCIPPIFDDTN